MADDSTGGIPSLDQFLAETIPLNPKASKADLIRAYQQTFFGNREDGSLKGFGFFGVLPSKDPSMPPGSYSTELSSSARLNGKETAYPLLTPNLTRAEIDHLLSGKKPTNAIYDKAEAHAKQRLAAGQNPFAEHGEQVALPDYPKGLVSMGVNK